MRMLYYTEMANNFRRVFSFYLRMYEFYTANVIWPRTYLAFKSLHVPITLLGEKTLPRLIGQGKEALRAYISQLEIHATSYHPYLPSLYLLYYTSVTSSIPTKCGLYVFVDIGLGCG